MKIIHAADTHLGSPFSFVSDEKKKKLTIELNDTFARLVEYAKNHAIKHILLAGDVFDKDKVSKKDKEFFYGLLKANKDLEFYYLRGNHDSNTTYNEELDNLHTFNDKWTFFTLEEGVTLSGIELTEANQGSLYSSLTLNRDDHNIVMMHGQETSSVSNPLEDIKIKDLENKNIDYLALGHIHKYSETSLDKRGKYVYPGCIQGRGFDEEGKKGFIVYDTDTKEATFISFAKRIIKKETVDISESVDEATARSLIISKITPSKDDIIQIMLTGKVSFDPSRLKDIIETALNDKFFYLEVKNKAKKIIKVDDYMKDTSLRGEFVRLVKNDPSLTEEMKNDILGTGLALIEGEELE